VADRLQRALALQQSGSWAEAEDLYREVLRCNPDLADAAHMLGVVHLQAGNYAEALRRLHQAAELFEWKLPAVRHNLGLAIAAVLSERSSVQAQRLWEAYDDWLDRLASPQRGDHPLVSVVLAAFEPAHRIETVLESVLRQSYAAIELIVIDDGSMEKLQPGLAHSPYRWQKCVRRDCAIAAAINDAISRSRGEFVNVLVGPDRFASTRVATMVDAIARTGAAWGFSRADFVGSGASECAPNDAPPAQVLAYLADDIAARDTIGISLLSRNPALSASALFFARSLFDELGGFREHPCYVWDFCLRASILAEPVYVPSAEYELGPHGGAMRRSAEAAERAAEAMLASFYDSALATRSPANPFAPIPAIWGERFFVQLLTSGSSGALPATVLRDVALRVAAGCGPAPDRLPTERA
jgi:tetratricopeptide (TPR) repeat protein